MSSDEEDFNDIYGDDEPSTTVEENKHAEAGAETIKEHEQDDFSASPASSSENNNNNSNVTEDVSNSNNNNVSSLDQLAALQALSSNLNQINNNSDNTNKDVSSNSNDSNVNSDINNNNNNNNNNNSNKTALPWEQLQQTMSQFNPQQNTQEGDNGTQKHVKADISKDNCKMFIGGLNWETTEEGLRNYFNKYGHVIDLKIMKDPNTGRSRGFGFLTFESPSSVDEVVKTQHILDGKVIDPKRSIPREEQDKTGKIFVGGIGADVRPKEFEEFFAKYGTIIDAQLMLDKDTGRSRGFGFVTYDSPEAVDRVCQNKYIEFKGKQIEIKRAEPRHLQKGQYGGANPNNRNLNNYGSNSMHMGTGANSIAMNPNAAAAAAAAAMYQNPMMMTGFNPMMPGFNPQAMQEYYQKMQEYYQQMQQQTGIDYTQMYQQQMQQMAMMMPGFAMPTQQPQTGSQSPASGSVSVDDNGSNSTDVQTIGENNDMKNTTDMNGDNSNVHNNNNNNNNNNSSSGSSNMDRDNKGSNDSKSNTPDLNIPRGPRDPSSIPSHGGYPHRERGDRRGRRSDRGGYRGGSGNNYRGSRSGYNRRNNNGYHPYNR